MEAIERFVNVPGQSALLNRECGVLISLSVRGIKSHARGNFRVFRVGQQHCRSILISRYVVLFIKPVPGATLSPVPIPESANFGPERFAHLISELPKRFNYHRRPFQNPSPFQTASLTRRS